MGLAQVATAGIVGDDVKAKFAQGRAVASVLALLSSVPASGV